MTAGKGTELWVQIGLSKPDEDLKTVTATVTYKLQEVELARDKSEPLEFSLDLFDFPLIDNVRLGDGQRLALLLNEFDQNRLVVIVALFPGMYGSQRDKPFIDVIMQQLPKIVGDE